MKQSVSLVTLGVADYAEPWRSTRRSGGRSRSTSQETAFFEANGVVLVLWARDKLAADLRIPDSGARGAESHSPTTSDRGTRCTTLIEQARAAGAEIAREPAETFYGGYAGVFRDLDGHAWEVAHNPGFGLADDGSVVLPRC